MKTKKIWSLLLAVIFIFLLIIPGLTAFAVGDSSNIAGEEKSDIQSFIDEAQELLSYEPESMIKTASVSNGDKDIEDFSTCRLIVKADKKPEKLNSVKMASGFKDYYIIQFKNENDAKIAFEYYSNSKNVIAVSTDKIVENAVDSAENNSDDNTKTVQLTETPKRLNSWGSESMGLYAVKDYVIDNNILLPEVTVGVVGTGVDLEQEFFKGRLEKTGFDSSGIDSGSEQAVYGHETMVTSVIVDSTTDNVKIRNYKHSDGGTFPISAAVASMLQAVSDNVDIINCSFAIFIGHNWKNQAGYYLFNDVINTAYDSGILVVSSAGNYSNQSREPNCNLPATLEHVLTVSAVNEIFYPCRWTSMGKSVDVTAPGEDMPLIDINNSFTVASGTSFSSPLVTSVCAMVLSMHPEYTVDDLKDVIKGTATPYDSYNGYINNMYGTGIADAVAAVGFERPSISTNLEPGKYMKEISIEFTSDYDVYYTTDGTWPSKAKGTKYVEPITLYGDMLLLKAVSYNDDGIPSAFLSKLYRSNVIEDEANFEIDENGTLMSYNGSLKDFIIPSSVKGIEVKNITNNFQMGEVYGITLPTTMKKLGVQYTIDNKTFYVSEAFSENKNLMFVEGENIEDIGGWAFYLCTNLRQVNFPNAKRVGVEAFAATSLKNMSFPQLVYADDRAFADNSIINRASFPQLTTCGPETFAYTKIFNLYCPKLKFATMYYLGGKLRVFNSFESFSALDLLEFEGIDDILFDHKANFTVKNCIVRLEFSKLKFLNDFPGDYTSLVLPSTVESLPDNLSEYKVKTYTIYGSSGTYVERYAKEKGFEFIEVTPETAVITDLPKYYKAYMGELEADVVGFNRQYQWYENDVNSNEGGTPIEGATGKTFNPADYYAPYYYCVVTSKDGDFDEIEIKTSACENRSVNPAADYSAVDLALSKVPDDLSGYTKKSRAELTKAIEAVEYNLDKSKQDKVNEFAKNIETAINNLELIGVKLDKTEVDLYCDDSLKITAECESKVRWSSSEPSVAKVDPNGVVTAVGRGTATITATAENGESASCQVTVKLTWWQWILYIVRTAVNIIAGWFK